MKKTLKINEETHAALRAIQFNEYAINVTFDTVIRDMIRNRHPEYLNENFRKYYKGKKNDK